MAGTWWEEQNQSPPSSFSLVLSGRGVLSHDRPPNRLRRCTYHFTCIFCSTQSGFLSLICAPSLVAYCLVWRPPRPLLRDVLCKNARGLAALRLCQTLRRLLLCRTWFPACGFASDVLLVTSKVPVTMMGSLLDFFLFLNIHYTIICT